MKVKLVKAATIVYNGKVIHKGEEFEMKDEDVKRYKEIVEIIEDSKKRKHKGEGK